MQSGAKSRAGGGGVAEEGGGCRGEVGLIKDGGRKGRGTSFRSTAQAPIIQFAVFCRGGDGGGGRRRGEVHRIRDAGIEGVWGGLLLDLLHRHLLYSLRYLAEGGGERERCRGEVDWMGGGGEGGLLSYLLHRHLL